MCKNALVIGATGLLGYGVAKALNKEGWKVNAIGKEPVDSSKIFSDGINYFCGDFYDEEFLTRSLKGTDKVFFFLSTTFPHTSSDSLEFEILRTLKSLEYLLRKMRDLEIPEIVYPSSGGTVYGNVASGVANETDDLKPTTPYGVGKKMCEDILQFYSTFGISSTILRVGNVYGSQLVRNTAQGVIDLFVQNALQRKPVVVWGSALSNVRDYIFVDDFAEAVAKIGALDMSGIEVYNLGSGIGTTLEEIIQTINKFNDTPLKVNYVCDDATSSIKRIVLNIEKFKNKTNWEPQFNIIKGIAKTVERKKRILETL